MNNNEKKTGKVYLVGAGPGNLDLITLKGIKCLKRADTVVYDYLAAPKLMDYCQDSAELIYAGKKGGDHSMSQDQISNLLAEKCKQGQQVVRLKGGDPFIFGRGGEEAALLAQQGLEFEIVPGVTSAVAAPAYAGIPVTHRDYSSTLTLITGHENPQKNESALDWPILAALDGTLVFLMGLRRLPIIVDKLIEFGKPDYTKVAVIQWGATCRQRTVTGTLTNIAARVEENKISPPAIIVIGQVVEMRDKLSWFEKLPLFGKKILVTRSRSQASTLSARLTELGAQVEEIPTIDLEEIFSPQIETAFKEIGQYQWLIFTSPNGVEFFFNKSWQKGMDARILSNCKIATIGPGTSQALEKYCLKVDLEASEHCAEGVLEVMQKESLTGQRVLIPRAEKAREILPIGLEQLGAKVEVLPIYRTRFPEKNRQKLADLIKNDNLDLITFTSSSIVKNFLKLLSPLGPHDLDRKRTKLAAIGPITAAKADEIGLAIDIMPDKYTIEGLVEAIQDYYSKQLVRDSR